MADAGAGQTATPLPTRKKRGLVGLAWRLTTPVRRLLGPDAVADAVEGPLAVRYFLSEMAAAASRTYPIWRKLLDNAFTEYALSYDDRRALLEVHPLDDYYFAGAVALECARMRTQYDALEAGEILGEVGAQVDRVAGRRDRVVSDLVFHILGKIERGAAIEHAKTPHDKVVKAILQQMGVDRIETTRGMMRDKALRHILGEPLALGVPQWWRSFKARFRLEWPGPDERNAEQEATPDQPDHGQPAVSRFRGRRRRRAVPF